ncbi:hypothetical protein ACJX0J_016595, partial [Zea mays]
HKNLCCQSLQSVLSDLAKEIQGYTIRLINLTGRLWFEWEFKFFFLSLNNKLTKILIINCNGSIILYPIDTFHMTFSIKLEHVAFTNFSASESRIDFSEATSSKLNKLETHKETFLLYLAGITFFATDLLVFNWIMWLQYEVLILPIANIIHQYDLILMWSLLCGL